MLDWDYWVTEFVAGCSFIVQLVAALLTLHKWGSRSLWSSCLKKARPCIVGLVSSVGRADRLVLCHNREVGGSSPGWDRLSFGVKISQQSGASCPLPRFIPKKWTMVPERAGLALRNVQFNAPIGSMAVCSPGSWDCHWCEQARWSGGNSVKSAEHWMWTINPHLYLYLYQYCAVNSIYVCILISKATSMSASSSWQYLVTNMSASLQVETRLCIMKNYSTYPDHKDIWLIMVWN